MEGQTVKTRISFDTVAVWVLSIVAILVVVGFIPLIPVSLPSTKAFILATGIILTLIVFVAARLVRGNIIVPPLMLLGSVWLVPIAYGLSTLFSGANPLRSIFGSAFEPDTFGFMLVLAVLTTLAALSIRRVAEFKLFYRLLALGSALVFISEAGFLIASKFLPNYVTPTTNVIGSFTDLGMFAGLFLVVLLVALRLLEVQGIRRWLVGSGIALALLVLVLANAELVWIMTGLTALAFFVEALMRRRAAGNEADLEGAMTLSAEESGAQSSRTLIAPLIVLVVSVFFLIAGGTLGSAAANALGIQVLDVRPSWSATLDIGSHTYAASPFFGSGPATFIEDWSKFRDRSLNDTLFWSIDFPAGVGIIPTSFVTTGVVGAIAWLILIGVFLFTALRAFLFRFPEDAFMRFVSVSSFAATVYVLILAFLSTPGPVVLALGFLALGIFVSTLRYGKGKPEWGIVFARNPRIGFVIVFVLTLVLLASVAAGYFVATRYLALVEYANGSTALSAGNLDAGEHALAASLSYASSAAAYRASSIASLGRMQMIANDTKLPQTTAQQQFQTALSNAVSAALTATQVEPADYQNWLALANVYQSVTSLNIQGAYDAAKAAYARAEALNPTSPILPYSMAQLEIARNNSTDAETDLLAAVNLKHDYTPGILLLAQLEIQLGKAKEALQAAEAAAYFAPNDPSVQFQVGILKSGLGDTQGAIAALSQAVTLNSQYANARYFLAAMYASAGQFPQALEQMKAVAALSADNATAVASDLAAIQAGKNPFTVARLRSLGVPSAPVNEPAPKSDGSAKNANASPPAAPAPVTP